MSYRKIAVILLTLGLSIRGFAGDTPQPIKPFKTWKEVQNPELKKFNAPVADRYVLPNGLVLFLLEDHELPLIELSMTTRFGDLHETPDKWGVGDATANIMRSGGSAKYPGDKLDIVLEDMAASIGFGSGQDSGSGHLSTLKEDFDKGLDVFMDVLRRPEFPQEKIDLYLAHARTGISKRNDSPNSISGREFRKAMYGAGSPFSRVIEYDTLDNITRDSLRDWHKNHYHPNLFIMGIVGDFKKDEMLNKIKTAFADYPKVDVKLPEIPKYNTEHAAKNIYVDRPAIRQTTITMGHFIDLRRNSPDYPAIQMMNEILGGGMAARMFTEVRTKKGLAYSVFGMANIPYNRPGIFSCSSLTRNEQALETVDALREEVVKIKDKGITDEELAIAKESVLNSFVFNFDTPSKIIGRQITYEFYSYPMDFAETLLQNIKKVTVADVNRVAKQYLDPDKMVLLGVGNSAGLDDAKSFKSLKDVQLIDVTIPPSKKK